MSLRCAAYARYSTDKQNPLSIEDQIRKCKGYAQERGWRLVEQLIYSDAEVTGAILERPGLNRLLSEAESPARSFDVILAEDTSRLSRKQADVLNICERLSFAGVRLCFVSQGIDSTDEKFQLLLTARGMIDQLFLADTAKRVHRGMEGLARRGLHTGGRCYAYRRRVENLGVRLEVEETEAATVRRIFEMYADGRSLKQIAKRLNADCIPSPQPQLGRIQRSWAPTAIRHILRNERYIGRCVWNKKHKVRNPATGRRVYRRRPESEWVCVELPSLRIVSDDLWQRVRQRFEFVSSHYGTKSRPGLVKHWNAIGSSYLFSGILRCQQCGASMNIVSGAGKRAYAKYGCPMHHLRGTCFNDLTERSEILEERLLHALQEAVLQPEVVDYTLTKFEAELKARLDSMSDDLEALRRRKHTLEAEIKRLTDALAAASDSRLPSAVITAINEREDELRTITDKLLEASRDSIQARVSDIRQFVISKLSDLRTLLNSDVPTAKAEILRHVDRIDLTPMQANGERFFVASGEWDLLGGYSSRKSVGAAGRS
jgi:DNA invertase Pin-like site-specific DNA recombinase